MQKRYSVRETFEVGKRASLAVGAWLRGRPETLAVIDVEHEGTWQRRGIDLVWVTKSRVYGVEVKGDRYHKTGNFFLETVSNLERGTPGCFLYTQADLFFYYFVESGELYVLPMPETREWFLGHRNAFEERDTTTPTYRGGHYTTRGSKVPIARVRGEVPNVRLYSLPPSHAPN